MSQALATLQGQAVPHVLPTCVDVGVDAEHPPMLPCSLSPHLGQNPGLGSLV